MKKKDLANASMGVSLGMKKKGSDQYFDWTQNGNEKKRNETSTHLLYYDEDENLSAVCLVLPFGQDISQVSMSEC